MVGFARIGGRSIGIGCQPAYGFSDGVLDVDSSKKGSRFL
ncbi:MAG: hypothetical protein R2769_04070 [Saprospiraceae bacterium]